jgi:hypothetical protein
VITTASHGQRSVANIHRSVVGGFSLHLQLFASWLLNFPIPFMRGRNSGTKFFDILSVKKFHGRKTHINATEQKVDLTCGKSIVPQVQLGSKEGRL